MAAKKPAAKSRKTISEPQKAELIGYYRDMLLIRRFEEKAGQLYGMGLIAGFCHLYIGQEAVVVGVQSVLDADDQVITGYRDHGHMLAAGMTSRGVMAELTGREGGYARGKGGSMHMFSREKNFFGGHGIVARRCRSGRGWRSRTSTRDRMQSASRTSAMGHRTRDRSMRRSTWRLCGSCRSSM